MVGKLLRKILKASVLIHNSRDGDEAGIGGRGHGGSHSKLTCGLRFWARISSLI